MVLLVLVAAVEVLVAGRVQLEIQHAAREGARAAATSPDIELAVDAARRSLGGALSGRATVSVQRQQHVGGEARVTVSVRHSVGSALFGGLPIALEASVVMRVER